MKSKTKYPRIGDIVTIIDPRPIERIRYEICVETVIPEVEKDPDVIAFIESQRLKKPRDKAKAKRRETSQPLRVTGRDTRGSLLDHLTRTS